MVQFVAERAWRIRQATKLMQWQCWHPSAQTMMCSLRSVAGAGGLTTVDVVRGEVVFRVCLRFVNFEEAISNLHR